MSYLNGIIVDIDEGERGRAVQLSDGRVQHQSKITLSEEGYQMLRQGYLCGRCLQDLTPLGAFPEECPVCHFRVRELQLLQLQEDFVGEEELGPRTSLSDEMARLGELWLPEP